MTLEESLVQLDWLLSQGATEIVSDDPVLRVTALVHGISVKSQLKDWNCRGSGEGNGRVGGYAGGRGYGTGFGFGTGGGAGFGDATGIGFGNGGGAGWGDWSREWAPPHKRKQP